MFQYSLLQPEIRQALGAETVCDCEIPQTGQHIGVTRNIVAARARTNHSRR